MDTPIPMLAHIQLDNGYVDGPAEIVVRRLSDMSLHYQHAEAVREMLNADPVIYRVYMPEQSGDETGLYAATSVIEPGTVGGEYFMTKGHFHQEQTAPEIYLTLSGNGFLLMQNNAGEIQIHKMQPGSLSHIPGTWAHRTINTGDTPLVFFGVWPVEAGHDYESIEKSGFLRRIFRGDNGPEIIASQSKPE